MKKILLVIGIVALAVSSTGVVIYQLYQPHYEPVTEVEYPGSSINISLPSTTPNQSLEPAPYPALGLFPKPGAKNVPLITRISMSFPRPPQFLKLEVEPEVEISHVKKELIFYSGKYTFYLAKPLQPETTYTVTVIAGQKKPPASGAAPTATTTWQFTTISKRMIGIFFVVLIIVCSAVFIGMRYKRRKDVGKKRGRK
ncbi:MAG: Ig-like domain-containing protein [Euryarchaeota archaeon]|nr:Ig-like domain-containing protein [Euryarchaeota archaeon]